MAEGLGSAGAILMLVSIGAVAGCSDSAGPQPALQIRLAAGDDQSAPAGSRLPQPLEVEVTGPDGAPRAGITVSWTPAGGSAEPTVAVTNADGRAQTVWTMGTATGAVSLRAHLDPATAATFHAYNLGSENGPPLRVVRPLTFSTFDGSGQVVHPDFAATPPGVMGFPSHLAITPYPGGNAAYELPSLFASEAGYGWQLEAGAPNPVVTASGGYMSDPDLVYVPDAHELWMYYRQVTGQNIIHLRRSPDGMQWGSDVTVLSAPNHQIISPAVVYRGPGDWLMWSVNAGPAGCAGGATEVELRRSSDGIVWSPPVPVSLNSPAGLSAWHIDVQWIAPRNEFWALYNAKQRGGCLTPALFLATSPDGRNWRTLPEPVLQKGSIPAFQDAVYRSTFAYDPIADEITFWFSGARWDGHGYAWSGAVERVPRTELWPLSGAPTAQARSYDYSAPPAPLTDWP